MTEKNERKKNVQNEGKERKKARSKEKRIEEEEGKHDRK